MYNVSVVRYRYGLLLNLRYKKTDKVKEMKKNVNVFIAVLLVAVLCGGVIWLQTADEEKLGWNIHDSYGDTPSYSGGAAYTNATFAGPSAGEGGVMPLSSSSALRARTSYSYAGAYSGASSSPIAYSQSPIANSLTASSPSGAGLYTTSSKTFNSYGGGGNGGAAMGGAISNGRSNSALSNPSLQGGAGVGSISPIAYNTARRGEMSGGAGVNPAMMAAENPAMAMANAANIGMSNGFYAGMGYTTVDYFGTASYGTYRGMQGRRNSNTIGGNVLNDWILGLIGDTNNGFMFEYGGIYYFDKDKLHELYMTAIQNGDLPQGITWEQFLSWFETKSDQYLFPIPDGVWFMCILALGYTLFIIFRRKKQQVQIQ